MRILISHPDTIGDLVLRQPMLAAMVDAGHELMMVVRKSVEPLAQELVPSATILTHPTEVYGLSPDGPWDAFEPIFSAARAFGPTAYVVAPFRWTLFEEKLAATLPEVPRVGMTGNLYRGDPFSGSAPVSTLKFDRVASVAENDREIDKNAALAAAIGCPVKQIDPVLTPSQASLDEARRLLSDAGIEEGQFWAACVGGTAHVAIKTWPAERWGAALNHWHTRYGRKFVFVGLPEESEAIESVRAAMGDSRDDTVSFANKNISLATLQAVLSLSSGYVGHDTGPMHIAAAVGKPVLAVFGGGTWLRFLPAVSPSVAITVGVPCVGCGWICPFDASFCIKSVPVEKVTDAIDDIEAGRVATRESRVIEPPAALMSRLVREATAAAEIRLRESVDARRQLEIVSAAALPVVVEEPKPAPEPEPPPPPAPVGPSPEELIEKATAPLHEKLAKLDSRVKKLQADLDARPVPSPESPSPSSSPRRPWRQVMIDLIIGRQHIYPKAPKPPIPVSVVVPFTDEIERVRATVRSLTSQDYPNLEVILTHNGKTADAAKELADADDRVRAVSSSAATALGMVHEAMEQSYGHVLAFCNPGVVYEPGAVARAAEFFKRRPFAGFAAFPAVRAEGAWRAPFSPHRRIDTLDFLSDEPVPYESLFWRRRTYQLVGGMNVDRAGLAADWDVAVRSARMFGISRGHGTAVVVPVDRASSPARSSDRTSARSKFQLTFGTAGRVRCGVIRYANRARDVFDDYAGRSRLTFITPSSLIDDAAVTATDTAFDRSRVIPCCPLTKKQAGQFVFSDTSARGVCHVYYCRDSYSAVVHQTGASSTATSPHAGYPVRHAWTTRKDAPFVGADTDTATSSVLKTYELAAESHSVVGRAQSLVDISCGDGAVLAAFLAKTGSGRAVGVESDGAKRAMARARGYRVFEGSPLDAALLVPDGQTFDVVVVGSSLQRTEDPITLLRRVRNLLAPGGVILLTLANLDSAMLDIFGPTWAGWDVGHNGTILSPKAVSLISVEAGLKVEMLRTTTFASDAARSVARRRTGITPAGTELSPDDRAAGQRLAGWANLLWNWRRRGDVIHAILSERE